MGMTFGILAGPSRGGTVRSPEEFKSRMKRAADKVPDEAEKAVRKVLVFAVGTAQEDGFRGIRTGAYYYIKDQKRTRRKKPLSVTAPRKKLGIFEGYYRDNIKSVVKRSGSDTIGMFGSSGVAYARLHEFGGTFKAFGKYSAKMPKRPVIKPAMKKAEKQIGRKLGLVFEVLKDV